MRQYTVLLVMLSLVPSMCFLFTSHDNQGPSITKGGTYEDYVNDKAQDASQRQLSSRQKQQAAQVRKAIQKPIKEKSEEDREGNSNLFSMKLKSDSTNRGRVLTVGSIMPKRGGGGGKPKPRKVETVSLATLKRSGGVGGGVGGGGGGVTHYLHHMPMFSDTDDSEGSSESNQRRRKKKKRGGR